MSFPLINSWQGRFVNDPDAARQGLIEQISNPVRWTETVMELRRHGINRFVEVGPSAVLLGLCRNIDASLSGVKFGEPADLANLTDPASTSNLSQAAQVSN